MKNSQESVMPKLIGIPNRQYLNYFIINIKLLYSIFKYKIINRVGIQRKHNEWNSQSEPYALTRHYMVLENSQT